MTLASYAYMTGYQAFEAGQTEDMNPYHHTTENYRQWDTGYFQASMDADNARHVFVVRNGGEVHRVKRERS